MRWELYCRVIDNHGDLGVCWRLARQLAGRGEQVRLWVDDGSALAWMAPQGAPGVQVRPWGDAAADDLGDVVVEAFGCDPPARVVQALRLQEPPRVWINLEYLSAEPWVERSHGLPSPQPGGRRKWFFFPGFTATTGGLLREPLAPIDRTDWLALQGWAPRPGESVMSLFCYPGVPLAHWVRHLLPRPLLLLAAPGPATEAARALPAAEGLRVIELPWLPQPVYDTLLRCCDLNAVRGEDSFTQAHWSDAPLLWHIYPQDDGVHAAKLRAWVDRVLQPADAAFATGLHAAQRHWNGLGPPPDGPLDLDRWQSLHRQARERLRAQADLVTQLMAWVAAHAAC